MLEGGQSSDTTGDAVTRLVIRWLWRIDAATNRLCIWTGRLAVAAINWALRRHRKRQP